MPGRVRTSLFHPAVQAWFDGAFAAPTRPQRDGWPPIARGESTLILAPTGTGKTLTAFLACLDRLMFTEPPPRPERCRVLYISPLKALAVDVERNLRAPLAGIANVANARGDAFHTPLVSIRTGDTPAAERARFGREPADILITTPESLFLLLTSNARDRLRSVETVIIDEIHALVSTKRGAHLALSLERLEALQGRSFQRIGLSATQRNLDEVARYLGGTQPGRRQTRARTARASSAKRAGRAERAEAAEQDVHAEFGTEPPAAPRDVTIVDAREPKRLEISVDVPMADMSMVGKPVEQPSGPAAQGPVAQTIWSAIHPRLLELIQAHRSTLIFVNSRRLAERLAAALNELAGESLVRAHHGSLARAQRTEIEDLLKAGRLRGLVATSSLELGIDMGAIDLVVQIEAPPSVASGLQRIGRSGHQVNEVSAGIIFPKFRGDLLACAAVTGAMTKGQVEPSRYPRNPLDVLAQQIVAMASMDAWPVDDLYARVRQAAPFATLGRRAFDGVLDMLSGRYPSDEFAELRPRVTWDRVNGTITARQGAKRVAIANAGTIPDRGLFGVFLSGADRDQARVGELDEEMVFEARAGETFLLGASSWRIDQITHDRVLVSPAPGEPGKMPFWKGEGPGRPIELGRAIGALVRDLRRVTPADARARLESDHGLAPQAADNLLQYLDDQHAAVETVPDDRTVLVERTTDELGDWRISVLTPFGSRVHAPWAMAATVMLRDERGLDAEVMWSDDGFVVRVPEGERPPETDLFLPDPDDVERLVVRQLGSTAMFAARFREAAGRALLLPRRRPGARAPLWQQRKRAADLLAVASRFGSFPIVLETYRECLRDIFDVPALIEVLRDVRSRRIRVSSVDARTPSPFAASLMFGYVANYLYDGDAPLAERRAQALAVDQSQLRELIGEGELRDLIDAQALTAIEHDAQCLTPKFHARSADAVHDLLLRLGDLSIDELEARSEAGVAAPALRALVAARRVLLVRLAGEERAIAVEDAARYRDALGTPLPPGLPDALLEPSEDAVADLVRRYARTHGPFTPADVAARFGLGPGVVLATLQRLAQTGRVVEGEFRPGGHGREWCEAEILRGLRRRSLARLRHEVEPVEPAVLGRFLVGWHNVVRKRRGLDALLDVVEQLQGAPLVASVLERHVLPARIDGYTPALLDTLVSAGEVTWTGVEPLGDKDGRIALYLTDHLHALLPASSGDQALVGREALVLAFLIRTGASFFGPIHEAAGGGFPAETVDALWSLVWRGLITNDTLHPLRAYAAAPERTRRGSRGASFRSRRLVPPSAEGRWSAIAVDKRATLTAWAKATAEQLLARHGIVTRDVTSVEPVSGGFSAIYPVLRRLEDTGRVRRGYFIAGLGAAQFAQPGAVDLLRAERDVRDEVQVATLAATDPANPYGALVPWPEWPGGGRAARGAGARVMLVDGMAAAWIARGDRQLLLALPADEPDRSRVGRAVGRELTRLAYDAPDERRGWLLAEINGEPATATPLGNYLVEAGFQPASGGLLLRVPRRDT
ncbi:MAG: DEAD/DEAH box helicase [Acidobacteria bacterium]|nr:DEAD/DEAH box helicase [Acidobacteriota bacterium]